MSNNDSRTHLLTYFAKAITDFPRGTRVIGEDMIMNSGCPNFVPNLWKPLLCSNCLQAHSLSAPPSPVVTAVGRSRPPLTISIPSPSPLSNSHPIPPSTHKQPRQTATIHEHKRSNSSPAPSTTTLKSSTTTISTTTTKLTTTTTTKVTPTKTTTSSTTTKTTLSTSANVPRPTKRTDINNALSHNISESAKRKKGDEAGPCDTFSPQLWRPTVCMHCFEPIAIHTNIPFNRDSGSYMGFVNMDISPHEDDGNGGDDTLLASTIPLPATPRTPRDVDEALVKLSSLSFSQERRQQQPTTPRGNNTDNNQPTTPRGVNIPTTPKGSTTPRLSFSPRSLPPNFFPSSMIDDDDPFRDFEELYDSTFDFKTKQEIDITSTLQTVRSNLSRSREKPAHKYRESEDDWDGGVDMDVESFVAKADYSYVNNKIMEIASVKKEAERSQAVMQENPEVMLALYEILTAKQKQIQKALDREKINEQDHNKLIERLNAVKDLLKPNHQAATW